MQEQHYLTAADVTRLLRIDKSTVYRMAEDGRLRGIKVGRQWRFPAESVRSAFGVDLAEPGNGQGNTVIDLAKAEALGRLFGELFDVMVVVADLEGHPLTPVINPSAFFSVLSAYDGVLEQCTTEWAGYAKELPLTPHLRRSHLGFLCARAYVRDGFNLVAMVIAGGIAPDDWLNDPADLEKIASQHAVPLATLIDSAGSLRAMEPTEQQTMVTALSTLARHLSPDHSPPGDNSVDQQRSP